MKKKIPVIIMILLTTTMMTTPIISSVHANNITETDMEFYTEYVGTLGGAGFALLKPKSESWNGMLVVACHFFMSETMWTNDPKSGLFAAVYQPMGQVFASMGYAFAYSTYGEPGYCIKTGMIRTHQLTEWVIENHEVTNEVFLFGYSMGFISVLLAEKYPELYDGVLDVVGPKDLKTRYNSWIGLPDPFGILSALENECGGTPEEKPQAYEKRSPTYNADIKVPIISLYGEEDTNVPPIQAELFYEALSEDSIGYYRSYMYPGYGHFTFMANPSTMFAHFIDLVLWVKFGIEPPPHPPAYTYP
jgi:pimeloyl-ACP methyl ester carboxylesterase